MPSALARRISSQICKHPRLDRVPVPVLDEAVERALEELDHLVPPETTVGQLSEIEEFCEACDEPIVPGERTEFRDHESGVVVHGRCMGDGQ